MEYIGIAFDEQKRIYSYPDGRTVRKYPLIEWEMTEADCLNYCHEKGFDWKENGKDLYGILGPGKLSVLQEQKPERTEDDLSISAGILAKAPGDPEPDPGTDERNGEIRV